MVYKLKCLLRGLKLELWIKMGGTEFENNNFWLVGPWTTKEITGHHYEERITEKKQYFLGVPKMLVILPEQG